LLSLKFLLFLSPPSLLYFPSLLSSKAFLFSCLLPRLLPSGSLQGSFFRVLLICLATFGLFGGSSFLANIVLSQAADAFLNLRKMSID
jgi:uncharacterized membrane protein